MDRPLDEKIRYLTAAHQAIRRMLSEEETAKQAYEELVAMLELGGSQMVSQDARGIMAQEAQHFDTLKRAANVINNAIKQLEQDKLKFDALRKRGQEAVAFSKVVAGGGIPSDFSPSWIHSAFVGHYGGLIVKVPAEHWDKFKACFPPSMFPKKEQLEEVTKLWTDFGVKRFWNLWPNSRGLVYTVHFADSSKGLELLEKLFGDQPVKGVVD